MKLFLVLLFTSVPLSALANLHDFVGSWSGQVHGEPVEITIWYIRKGHDKELGGYLLFPNSNCVQKLEGQVPSASNYDDYAASYDTFLTKQQFSESYRIASRFPLQKLNGNNCANANIANEGLAGMFNGWLSYSNETKQASLLYTGTQTSKTPDRAKQSDDLAKSLIEAITTQGGQVDAGAIISGHVEKYREENTTKYELETALLERANATKAMLSLIAQNPAEHVSNPINPELRLIENGRLYHAEIGADINPLTCSDHWLDAQKALKARNLIGVITFPVSETEFEMVHWGSNGEQSGGYQQFYKKQILPKTASVDWINIHASVQVNYLSDEQQCLRGQGVQKYLQALDQGQFDQYGWQSVPETELIRDVKGTYLVGRNGVDNISQPTEPLYSIQLQRQYGTTTIFEAGDFTRHAEWRMAGQNFLLSNTVKNSHTFEVEVDFRGKNENFYFQYDSDASQRYGGGVWKSRQRETQPENACVKWKAEYQDSACIERAVSGQPKTLYLVKDLAIAESLFDDISPDARHTTLAKDEGCTFCDFSGGEYLNAVYAKNFSRLQELDTQYLRDYERGLDNDDNLVLEFITGQPMPLLNEIVGQYMKGYSGKPEQCFQEGAREITYSYQQPDWVTTDFYGNEVDRFTGGVSIDVYRINKAFIPACDLVCNRHGSLTLQGLMFDKEFEWSRVGKLVKGIEELNQQLACDDPKRRRFESNFVQLFANANGLSANGPLYFERNTY